MQIALIKFDLKSDENITIDLGFISENIKTFQSVAAKNDLCSSNFPTDKIYFRMRIDSDINATIDLSSNSEFILYDFTVNYIGCPKNSKITDGTSNWSCNPISNLFTRAYQGEDGVVILTCPSYCENCIDSEHSGCLECKPEYQKQLREENCLHTTTG